MHDLTARKDALPEGTSPRGESRIAELGGYTVEFGTSRAGVNLGEDVYHGLPDNACPTPHWGVLLSGEWQISLTHNGEGFRVRAGDAYYLPAGHRLEVVADSEYVEFSPHELHRQTREAIYRNLNTAQPGHFANGAGG